MIIKTISVAEMLGFRTSSVATALIFFSAEDCRPCDVLSDALGLVCLPSSVLVLKAIVSPSNKREFGAVLKAGISRFPRIELYEGGKRLVRYEGVQGEDTLEVARWLERSVTSALYERDD